MSGPKTECEKTRAAIYDGGDEAALTHLATCAECAEVLRKVRVLDGSLEDAPSLASPTELARAKQAVLRAMRTERAHPEGLRWAWPLALAAGTLIAATAVWFSFQPPPADREPDASQAPSPSPPAPTSDEEPEPALDESPVTPTPIAEIPSTETAPPTSSVLTEATLDVANAEGPVGAMLGMASMASTLAVAWRDASDDPDEAEFLATQCETVLDEGLRDQLSEFLAAATADDVERLLLAIGRVEASFLEGEGRESRARLLSATRTLLDELRASALSVELVARTIDLGNAPGPVESVFGLSRLATALGEASLAAAEEGDLDQGAFLGEEYTRVVREGIQPLLPACRRLASPLHMQSLGDIFSTLDKSLEAAKKRGVGVSEDMHVATRAVLDDLRNR